MVGARFMAAKSLVGDSLGVLETHPYGLDGVSLDVGRNCRRVGAGL